MVFIFPESIVKLDCIVKHLICTLVVNNCFLIPGIVTCQLLGFSDIADRKCIP